MLSRLRLITIATVISAIAFYFSTQFHSIYWLAWLAPIPVLLIAYWHRSRWWQVIPMAFIAYFIGSLNIIVAYLHTLMPMSALFDALLLKSLLFTMVILISHLIIRFNKSWFAVFSYPTCMALTESIHFTSNGSVGSLAYTQMSYLPILQISSLGGFAAITFTMSLLSSAVAFLLIFKHLKRGYIAFAITAVLIIVALGYGANRLNRHSAAKMIKVGLVDTPYSASMSRLNPAFSPANAKTLAVLITQASKQGAKIVMTSEESLAITPNQIQHYQNLFSQLALQNHIYLIIGVALPLENQAKSWQQAKRYNAAWIFDNDGKLIDSYRKQHTVPEIEARVIAGHKLFTFNINNIKMAVAINRDLDYKNPSNNYAKQRVQILFVPAWDFFNDGWLHAKGAFIRSIANGFSLARVAHDGFIFINNNVGQFYGLSAPSKQRSTVLVVNAPVSIGNSFYAQHPNVFPVILIIILLILLGQIVQLFLQRKKL